MLLIIIIVGKKADKNASTDTCVESERETKIYKKGNLLHLRRTLYVRT